MREPMHVLRLSRVKAQLADQNGRRASLTEEQLEIGQNVVVSATRGAGARADGRARRPYGLAAHPVADVMRLRGGGFRSRSLRRWRSPSRPPYREATLRPCVRGGVASGSRAAGLAIAFKLVEAAPAQWRAVNAPPLSPRPRRQRPPGRTTRDESGDEAQSSVTRNRQVSTISPPYDVMPVEPTRPALPSSTRPSGHG